MATATGVTAARMDDIAAKRYSEFTYLGTDVLYYRRADLAGYIPIGTFTGPRGPTGEVSVNQSLVDAAVIPLQPGPWQTLPFITTEVSAYSSANYGTPRYRIEQDSIRFVGALSWVGATRGPIVSNPYYFPITQALPAQYRPTYEQSRSLKLKNSVDDVWDLRFKPDGTLGLIFNTNGTFMTSGNVIYLNVVYILS